MSYFHSGRSMFRHPGWPASLQHGRVGLRPLRLRDARLWSRLRLRNREPIMVGEFRSPLPYKLENSTPLHFLSTIYVLWLARRGRILPWVITYDGRFVGRLNVFRVVRGEGGSAEIGGWVDSTVNGRGIYTTARVLATDHCFTQVGLGRIYSHVHSDNVASLRVNAKVGFREEQRFGRKEGDGVEREWRRLAISAADYPDGQVRRLLPPS